MRSWKGYDFGALDSLAEKGYIRASRESKSVILTDEGMREAEALQEAFLRAIGERYRQDARASSARLKAMDEVEFPARHVSPPSGCLRDMSRSIGTVKGR